MRGESCCNRRTWSDCSIAQTEVAIDAHAAVWHRQYGDTDWLDYRATQQ